MRSLLGWLGTRLAQITSNYLEIADMSSIRDKGSCNQDGSDVRK